MQIRCKFLLLSITDVVNCLPFLLTLALLQPFSVPFEEIIEGERNSCEYSWFFFLKFSRVKSSKIPLKRIFLLAIYSAIDCDLLMISKKFHLLFLLLFSDWKVTEQECGLIYYLRNFLYSVHKNNSKHSSQGSWYSSQSYLLYLL